MTEKYLFLNSLKIAIKFTFQLAKHRTVPCAFVDRALNIASLIKFRR